MSTSSKPGRAVAAKRGVILLGLGWFVALAAGLRTMADYELRPGPATPSPAAWPAETGIPRAAGRPTGVLFAHPRCPCTRASIDELVRVLTHARGRLDAWVVLFRPAGAPEGWELTDTWERAAAIPGVRVLADVDGREAARFGASTSGDLRLYGADGLLRFAGGITAARGQAGENAGAGAVIALLGDDEDRARSPAASRTPVYGCALAGD
jgi:hypothetical protein